MIGHQAASVTELMTHNFQPSPDHTGKGRIRMKRSAWLAGALALSITVTAMAAAPDGQEGTTSSPDTKSAAPTSAVKAVDPSHRLALEALAQERQAFVQGFNWNAGERQALRQDYARAMDAFARREMQLKKELFLATGRTEEAARLQASLERLANPVRNLPQVGTHPTTSVEAGK